MEAFPDGPDPISELVRSRDAFVRFVRPRVESDAAAEEIVQSAFLRGLEHGGELRADESATAWFYRILRNAIIDHYRRRDAAGRAHERIEREMPSAIDDAAPDERDRACACVRRLAATLKPEYAELLEKVDVEGRAVADFAGEAGITANNAAVRLHRARQALKKRVEQTCRSCATHGCLDCTCELEATARNV